MLADLATATTEEIRVYLAGRYGDPATITDERCEAYRTAKLAEPEQERELMAWLDALVSA